MLGFLRRRWLGWGLRAEAVPVRVADDVVLRARLSVAPGARASRVLVLLHGMGGSDRSTYLLATARHAWERGWSVLRANLRASGDEDVYCPWLYNAGQSGDLLAILQTAAGRFDRVAVAGFSLGAHLTVLTLGRHAGALPDNLLGAAAVSPPLDLADCADAVGRPGNEVYQRFFVRGLIASYARVQRRRPDLYEAGRERGLRTVREFDHRITAPYGGYGTADAYYTACSSGPVLASVRKPLLILAAEDDPVIPSRGLTRWPLPSSGAVVREMTRTGGHVGFVGRTRAPGSFWAAERILDFLEDADAGGRGG